MGYNLPASSMLATSYEALWGPYLAVLSDGDRQLVEDLFTRLRLESPSIIDGADASPFELSARVLLADVLSDAIRSGGDAEAIKEAGPDRVGESRQ